MHTALWKLYRLRVRGSARSIVARLKSPRGAALALFTLLVFGMMLGPNLVLALTLGRAGALARNADAFRELIPVMMLLLVVTNVVTSLGERALYFSPSDVDFLFPAPFSRREILLYKILGNVTAAVLIGLFFPTMLAIHIRSWPAAAVGCFLAWLMINSLTICVQLVAQSVNERAFTRTRRLFLWAVLAAAAVALGQAASHGLDASWSETLLRARHAPVAEIVLAPFTVFAKIIGAEQLIPGALGWTALGAAMVVCVYALAIRLDANYLETAAHVSRQVQKRIRRTVSDGILASRSRELRSSRLPQPPWLGGVGPLFWRQTVQAVRGSRGTFIMAAIAVLAMSVPLVVGDRRHSTIPPHMVIAAAVYMTFLYSAQSPLGFRGDYDRMDLLKSLPIRPLAIACAQNAVIVLMLTLLQWLVFIATALLMPSAATELLVAGLLILHFNWIFCGTENFLCLLFPSPLVVTGSEGFLKLGRVMLFMLSKALVTAACGAVAALPAAVVYLLTRSVLAACLAGWLALLLPSFGILLVIAWAFHRYDVSSGVSE